MSQRPCHGRLERVTDQKHQRFRSKPATESALVSHSRIERTTPSPPARLGAVKYRQERNERIHPGDRQVDDRNRQLESRNRRFSPDPERSD